MAPRDGLDHLQSKWGELKRKIKELFVHPDKFVWNKFEPPKAGPKGESQGRLS